jgi:hypothetical protein
MVRLREAMLLLETGQHILVRATGFEPVRDYPSGF